jgi:serine/threonine-protein kinase
MAIHGEKIVHRDIKPANIMIEGKNAKIIDFGISKRIENSVIITKRIGTIGYADTKMFDNDSHYKYEVDIYSAGLVITEIFIGKNYFTELA